MSLGRSADAELVSVGRLGLRSHRNTFGTRLDPPPFSRDRGGPAVRLWTRRGSSRRHRDGLLHLGTSSPLLLQQGKLANDAITRI